MANKITLNDISNLTGNPTTAETAINDNFTRIEEAIENTLSRDGTIPNFLAASLDANSQRIVNLPYALTGSEPVTLAQVYALVTGEDWTGGVGTPSVVFYQPEPPTGTAAGQVWVDTDDLSIWIWTGTEWLRQADPNLTLAINTANTASELATASSVLATDAAAQAAQALIDAAAAQSTADGAVLDAANALSVATIADGIADSALSIANAAVDSIDLLGPRVTAVEQDGADFNLAIIELENDVGLLAASISTTSADLGDLTSVVQTETLARISGDEVLAAAINTIQSTNAIVFIQTSAPVPGVGGVPDPIPEYSFWYDSDDGNHPYRYVDGVWTSVQDDNYTTLTALINSESIARIDADSALASDITTIQTTRNGDYALIVSNNQARIDADDALAASIDAVQVNVDGLEATVISNNSARIAQDTALANSINVLDARVDTHDGTLSTISSTITTNNTASVTRDSALTSSITVLNAELDSTQATITSVDTASVTRDNALTSSLNSLSTTVGGHTTSISSLTSSVNGIQGRYTVQIDSNGYVSGIDLIQNAAPGTAPYSTFTVTANAFRIVTPGSNPITPFQTIGGTTYIKDVVIDTAAIGTATIGTLNIAGSAVTNFNQININLNGGSPQTPAANAWVNLTAAGYPTAQITLSSLDPTVGRKSVVSLRGHFVVRSHNGGSAHWINFRVLRNDGVVLTGTPSIRAPSEWDTVNWEWFDSNPASTSHTYTVQVTRSAAAAVGDWFDISLAATNFKR